MKLSIITINLNHVEGLKKTISSINAQTYQDFEWIVIDGGSQDSSLQELKGHGITPTHLVSEEDHGVYDAMNKGIKLAKGEFLHFLNSGDQYESPDVLMHFFGSATYAEDLLYGNYCVNDGQGGRQQHREAGELSFSLFYREGLCHQSVFFRAELFKHVGLYNEQYRIAADWDFILRALLSGATFRHLDFPVVLYEGDGLSVLYQERSALEKKEIIQSLLPPALRVEAEKNLVLQKECQRLIEFEVWTNRIQTRGICRNIAMVSLWAIRKTARKIGFHGRVG